jgi:hypothetical protein
MMDMQLAAESIQPYFNLNLRVQLSCQSSNAKRLRLQRLETIEPRKTSKPCDYFEMIGGTSIGE